MKKLMIIAAAMTIAGGVYAWGSGGCNPDPEFEGECARVYKVKMTLKASRPKTKRGRCETMCYRKPARVRLQGYALSCDACACEDFQESLSWVLWNKREKSIYMDDEPVEWEFLNVIGRKANQVEGLFYIENYAFAGYAAGFGKMDRKSCIPANMKGEFAGSGAVPGCTSGDVCSPDVSCTWAFECADYCEGDAEELYDLPTAYTGKWAIRYSRSLSRKYAKTWSPRIPDYDYFEACDY